MAYIFKPLTTVLIIVFALLRNPGVSDTYTMLIIVGLLFSLAGDVFLMLPSDRFLAGLGSFLLAHICYILAFASDFGPYTGWVFLIPITGYAFIFLRTLLPYTCNLKIPVIVYSLILGIFLWQAMGRAWYLGDHSPLWALAGSILFVASDSILAYVYFLKSFKWSQVFILTTYWMAQLFIVMSI